MLEKVKGISIKGRCFSNETKLKFYQTDADRISIVYGRNGSGKSTISNAFYCISSGEISDEISTYLIDQNDKLITLPQDCKIHVFNEAYIDKNVKIDDDGLGAIILLGGQVNFQSEIDHYTEMLGKAYDKKESARKKLETFDDSHNPNSPEFHYSRIKKSLQAGWSVSDSAIRGNIIASKVTANVIKEICGLSVSETASQLKKKFEEAKSLLDKVTDTTIEFPTPISQIKVGEGFESNICTLLSKQINKPILTEREKQILLLIKSGKQSTIEQSKNDFSKEDTKICPYCFRPIDEDYKHGLIESINRVLNKDVDIHKAELSAVTFPDFISDYSSFASLEPELVDKIVGQCKVCNELVARYQKTLQAKYDNVYTPLNIEPFGIESAIGTLNSLLNQLEDKRQQFVNATKRKKDLRNELITINKQIAHVQIESAYRDYQRQKRLQSGAAVELEKSKREYDSIYEKIEELEQKKSDVGLAIKSINNALDYVFFSHGRLSIELKNDKYYLKSNGNDVKPKNISLGERNIIALCYFFTEILSNQDVSKLYQMEELVVIDDPISSFDFENKVGISSLLRYQTFKIIQGNNNSKILLLTHDLSTLSDMQKIADELSKESKVIDKNKPVKSKCFELSGRSLSEFKGSFNEYQELLKATYRYATGDTSGLDLTIGNIMRRTVEAFSTFMYGTGIAEISFNTKVLQTLGEYSVYFENLMYRLVLHGESHFENRIYGLQDDFHFYRFISPNEKQHICRNILCFMYFLSPDHIRSHLPEAVSDIQSWIIDIPKNSDFEIKTPSLTKVVRLYDFPLSAGLGDGIFDDEAAYDDYETDNKECDFALHVSGDSMEPTIRDSSIVLIKKSEVISEGEIGAFYLNGEVYCKKIIYKNGLMYLCSENSKYPSIEVHEEDSFKVYGKIVKIVGKL